MEIKVEKWITDEVVSFKILGIEKCCDKLINSKNITVNNEFDEEYLVKLCGESMDYTTYDDYDFPTPYYETINYCPFCGSPIFIEITNTIDKTKEYDALRKEREILWDKCKKTDSKNEELLLKEQIKEIDKRTNDMLTSDNFKDYFNRKQ